MRQLVSAETARERSDNNADNQVLMQGQTSGTDDYRGARGLDPNLIKEIEIQFGFDKPLHVRFWIMFEKNFLVFDFLERASFNPSRW